MGLNKSIPSHRWRNWTDDELYEYLMIREALADLSMHIKLSREMQVRLGGLVLRMDLLSDGVSALAGVSKSDIAELPETTLELYLGEAKLNYIQVEEQ